MEQIIFVLFQHSEHWQFFYKQTITFPSHLFYSMCFNSEEYRFERFWNELQSGCAGRDACDGSKLLYNDGNRSLKISKISVSLACYWQIGSKSTNHSPIAWRREGYKVTLVAAIGGFRSDLSITCKTDGNFGNVNTGVLFSRVGYRSTKMAVSYAWSQVQIIASKGDLKYSRLNPLITSFL